MRSRNVENAAYLETYQVFFRLRVASDQAYAWKWTTLATRSSGSS